MFFLCNFAYIMKRITDNYKIVAILGSVAVLILQGIWLYNTYVILQDELKGKCNKAFENAIVEEAWNRYNNYPNPEGKTITANTKGSLKLDIPVISEGVYKFVHKDTNADSLKRITYKYLSKEGIHSDFNIITSDNIFARKESGSIQTDTIYTRQNHSTWVQLEITNPYNTIFQRMGLILIASALFTMLIIFCISKQIKLILHQKKVQQIRNDFSYAIIHDMKSPLTSVIMGADFLSSPVVEKKPELKNKYIQIIKEEAVNMLALADRVLTLAKIESQRLQLNRTQVELEPLIMDLVDKCRIKATKRMSVDISNIQDISVYADGNHLKECIQNLLDNSMKYSKGDAIHIEIKAKTGKNFTEISVYDEGLGISVGDRKKIFDKFERGSALGRTMKGGAGGFGLGLNYVMQVINAHGGHVTVNSVEEKFSEFTIYLPNKDGKDEDTDC